MTLLNLYIEVIIRERILLFHTCFFVDLRTTIGTVLGDGVVCEVTRRKILVGGMTISIGQADVTPVCDEQVQECVAVGKVNDIILD